MCVLTGATLGCHRGNCQRVYHFPCARASGAVFTDKQQMFCVHHRAYVSESGVCDNSEQMKKLEIYSNKEAPTETGNDSLCWRVGALVVHSLGKIEQEIDGFHSEKYITPPGYMATRIFWSFKHAMKRTVYALKIDRNKEDTIVYSIIAADCPSDPIRGKSSSDAYKELTKRVTNANRLFFTNGDEFSIYPIQRKSRAKIFALNGPQVRRLYVL